MAQDAALQQGASNMEDTIIETDENHP